MLPFLPYEVNVDVKAKIYVGMPQNYSRMKEIKNGSTDC
jgi:hypothetical protein